VEELEDHSNQITRLQVEMVDVQLAFKDLDRRLPEQEAVVEHKWLVATEVHHGVEVSQDKLVPLDKAVMADFIPRHPVVVVVVVTTAVVAAALTTAVKELTEEVAEEEVLPFIPQLVPHARQDFKLDMDS
jgi:hypothetical protein